jgi:hypothetical protein
MPINPSKIAARLQRTIAGTGPSAGLGTTVYYNGEPLQDGDGNTLRAVLEDNEREINRQNKQDGQVPEKRVFVWRFGASANGIVSPGMKLTIGGIVYVVDTPLHPAYVGDTLVYLGVVTHQF